MIRVLFSLFIFPEAQHGGRWPGAQHEDRWPGLPYTLFLPNTKFMSEEFSKMKFPHTEKS
jgi:hypothetical protein